MQHFRIFTLLIFLPVLFLFTSCSSNDVDYFKNTVGFEYSEGVDSIRMISTYDLPDVMEELNLNTFLVYFDLTNGSNTTRNYLKENFVLQDGEGNIYKVSKDNITLTAKSKTDVLNLYVLPKEMNQYEFNFGYMVNGELQYKIPINPYSDEFLLWEIPQLSTDILFHKMDDSYKEFLAVKNFSFDAENTKDIIEIDKANCANYKRMRNYYRESLYYYMDSDSIVYDATYQLSMKSKDTKDKRFEMLYNFKQNYQSHLLKIGFTTAEEPDEDKSSKRIYMNKEIEVRCSIVYNKITSSDNYSRLLTISFEENF